VEADYAVPVKNYYGKSRYAGANKRTINGNPDGENISASYTGRFNLTTGILNRRHTRKTMAFSKRRETYKQRTKTLISN